MGGSQFTMTLCMGYAQTTKNDNGYRAHSRAILDFRGLPQSVQYVMVN